MATCWAVVPRPWWGDQRDYVGFWRYVLAICDEVRGNGLVPLIPCICLPSETLSVASAWAQRAAPTATDT